MTITRDELISILRDQLFIDVDILEDSALLFSSGIIDSFSLATLIVELETRGGWKFSALDITLENLDSIERMLRFIDRLSNTAGRREA